MTKASEAARPAEKDVSVSFVVIAYNEARNIARTLDSILAQQGAAPFEIVVVDDGSIDSTAKIVEAVAAVHCGVRLVRLGVNRGRGAARRHGVEAARAELVAFVDADIVLPPNWYATCSTALIGLDAVGGIALPDGDACFVRRVFSLTPKLVSHEYRITGNNGLYRRDVFQMVDFDARLRDGEDVDLSIRMTSAGLHAATLPSLIVSHEETKTFGESLRWLFQSGAGATRQLRRYRKVRRPDVAFFGFLATVALGGGLAALTRSVRPLAAVPIYVFIASTGHVLTRFEAPPRDLPRVVAACITDCALMGAYLAGRVRGAFSPAAA